MLPTADQLEALRSADAAESEAASKVETALAAQAGAKAAKDNADATLAATDAAVTLALQTLDTCHAATDAAYAAVKNGGAPAAAAATGS
jgi:hypothetical protein